MSDERLIDESALRAALRLEPDERPRRFDLAAARAVGGAQASPVLLLLGSIALTAVALAMAVTALRVAAALAATLAEAETLSLFIGVITALAEELQFALAIVTQPAVPIAIVACVIVAYYYERRYVEGEGHARAS